MNELYDIIAIFVTGGLFLACGLILLFISVPAKPLLNNYRKARYMMAVAYLFFVPCLAAEYFSNGIHDYNVALQQMLTLVIASLQSLLFTMALLLLLTVSFSGWRYFCAKAIPAILFVIIVIIGYIFCSEDYSLATFYVFSGIYAILLAYYSHLFLSVYQKFYLQMDNYFSDNETGRIRWIAFSFFAALSVGVMALMSTLFISTFVALLFSVVFDVFYIFFAIRFINYANQFHTLEHAMNNESSCKQEVIAENSVENIRVTADVEQFSMLEKKIEQWVADKHFTEKGITIEILAARLYTNRSYLSNYFNTYKGKTFREWMNQLRIEEAQNLLLQNPEMTISDVASQVGFSDKTNFRHHFVKLVGITPKEWKQTK